MKKWTEIEIYLVYNSYEIKYEITGKIKIINANELGKPATGTE